MRKVEFIYFDIGGVLIDYSKAFQNAAKAFNLRVEDIGKVFDENAVAITKGVITPKQLWKICIQRYSLKNAENYDFLESWVSDYQPIHVMYDLLYKIKAKYKIGLLSNIYKGMLPLLLKKKLIPNIQYEQIIFSCEVGMMKPDSDIFEFVQKKSKVPPNNILVVDDTLRNLDEARKNNWNTFYFNPRKAAQSTKELEEYLKNKIQPRELNMAS